MAGKKDIVKNALKVAGEYFSPDTSEYVKNLDAFFGPTDPSIRRRLYTGTSKDKDFSAFQESRHGTWLTANPEEASDYAMQNDSQSLRMVPGTWKYEPVNSASRVIPTYARVENPYRGELPDFARVDNYKKAQSDWFDTLRAQGYDAWVPDSRKGEMVVVLKDQGSKVKSAIGNAGTFDLSKKNMNKSEGGPVREGYQTKGRVVGDIVDEALKLVMGKGESAAEAGIRAYQGSPHNFAAERLVRFPEGRTEYIVGQPDVLPDVPEGAEVLQDFPLGRMRMDKIGTGEGAQAYGHGLYAAENERVAKGYRDTLAPAPTAAQEAAQRAISQYGDASTAANEIAKFVNDGGLLPETVDHYKTVEAILRGEAPASHGHMYEVRIDADPDAFLDWDKPLSEQSEAVRKAPSIAALIDEDRAYVERYPSGFGERLGANVITKVPERQLAAEGIPGIKYLDAGSRGAGDGTRNYVVFDDKLISIIRKYGIAGASAMLGYNLMENLDPKQAQAASMADQDFQASRPQRSTGGNNSVSNAMNVARGLYGVK